MLFEQIPAPSTSDPTIEEPLIHVSDMISTWLLLLNPCGKQHTEQNDTSFDEEEEESTIMYNLANCILEECKDAAPLSDLDTAIDLFRESFDRRPSSHPFHLDSLKAFAAALVTKFSYTNKREDLDEALPFCCKAGIGVMGRVIGSGEPMQFYVRTWTHSDRKGLVYHFHRRVRLPNTTRSLGPGMIQKHLS
jgi:hypothetical protein